MNLIRLFKTTILILSVSFLASCQVTPIAHERSTIPFDGNDQTAGFIRDFPDHSSEITNSARARYNGLIEYYGNIFNPPITRDFQLTPTGQGTWIISAEGQEKWGAMKIEAQDVTK